MLLKAESIKNSLFPLFVNIYIPSLQLAFELNGIFHYEPIFGKTKNEKNDKLNKIKDHDKGKFKSCIEKEISLCIIDTSLQKHFTEKSSQKYLDIVCEIISKELENENFIGSDDKV